MSQAHEILTFQFGTYANFVGAHFWNQQEANFVYQSADGIDEQSKDNLPHNDILYREGINNLNQTTYTPRLLSVDLAGTLAHLPVSGELYGNYVQRDEHLALTNQLQKTKEDVESNKMSSSNEVDVQEQPPAAISEYQRDLLQGAVNVQTKNYELANSSNSWADFLYARYHPRTLNVLNQYKQEPGVQPLGMHVAGSELWHSVAFNEDFCDRIRMYAEECDALQGFHMLFDIDDGFSGMASACLEHINDEYKRSSLVLPLFYPYKTAYKLADERTAHNIRVLNAVLSYHHLIDQASLFTPLCTMDNVWHPSVMTPRSIPGLQWQPENLYQTSAVLAAYLDTMSLGYRLHYTQQTLRGFCNRSCLHGRKLTAAGLALPLGLQQQQDLIDYLERPSSTSLYTQLTPHCEPGETHVLQSIVARGIPVMRLKRPPQHAGRQLHMATYHCDSVSQMLQLYYHNAYSSSISHVSATPLPLKTQLPFPYELFDKQLDEQGYLLPSNASRADNVRVASAPALAALQSSKHVGAHIEALHAKTHRIQLAKLQPYAHAGLERDEYTTALDTLLEFGDNYIDSQYL